MKFIIQLSRKDLRGVFEYLTSSDKLLLVKVKGKNPGEVHSYINKMVRERIYFNNGAYPIARLVESDRETLLLESGFVKKFRKAIERSRIVDLIVEDVRPADADTALNFFEHANIQARDSVYLTYLIADSVNDRLDQIVAEGVRAASDWKRTVDK